MILIIPSTGGRIDVPPELAERYKALGFSEPKPEPKPEPKAKQQK